MEVPRHTAKEVADCVAAGMDPDAESVAAFYYDAILAERDALRRKLDAVIAECDSYRDDFHVRVANIRAIVEGEA